MPVPRFLFMLTLMVLLMISIIHLEHRHRELQKWQARQIYQKQLLQDDLVYWKAQLEQTLEREEQHSSNP